MNKAAKMQQKNTGLLSILVRISLILAPSGKELNQLFVRFVNNGVTPVRNQRPVLNFRLLMFMHMI